MKAKSILAILMFLLALGLNASAQELSKSQQKEIKKTVKAMEKEGWKVKPGSMSLFDQQVRSIKAQSEVDNEGMDKWIVGSASSVSDIYDAAKMSAVTIAKSRLVEAVNQRTTVNNDNEMSNDQSKAEDNAITEEASKSLTSDIKTMRTKTLMECYREQPDGKIEVRVILAIPVSQAKKINKNN